MTYPGQTLMAMGIVFILCVRPSVQLSVSLDFDIACGYISWKKRSTFWHADVFRWLTLSLWVSVRLFTTFLGFFAFADKSLGRNGWVGVGGFSEVVATFNHVGGSFNLFMATSGDVWIIPSFRIWDYVLRVGHISCVITNCGQHQWVIPSLSIAL